MNLLNRVLNKQKKSTQLWLTIFGMLLGLVASMTAIVLIADINGARQLEDDVFGDNTLVVQKHVSTMTTIGVNGTQFSKEEIRDLQETDYILEVAPFKSANYEVGISENPGDGIPSFYAEMFLQSVPNTFLGEIDSTAWYWNSENDVVPIILPQDFLTLVNYGIAPAKGMPQVSEELVKSVRLKLHLIGPNKRGTILGRVIGFSSKISSVLVPEVFIDFSNSKYGSKKTSEPSRLFIKTEPNSFGKVNALMESMNLDISESELSISKITSYLIQMITLFFIFSIVILALSIMAFLQYLQMVLYQLNYEVRLLVKIGYQPKIIMKALQNQFLKLLLWIIAASMLLVFLIKLLIIQPVLESSGIAIGYVGLIFGILFVLLLLTGCVLLLRRVLLKTILKIFKKK